MMRFSTKEAAREFHRTLKKDKALLRAKRPGARVLIAKDALAQIAMGKIVPAHFVYAEYKRTRGSAELVDLLLGGNRMPAEPCQACALGALFISDFALRNGGLDSEFTDQQAVMHTRLGAYFSTKQLRLIENYFESTVNRNLGDPERLLTLILNNIIQNKGTFVPPKEWVQELFASFYGPFGLDRRGAVIPYPKGQ